MMLLILITFILTLLYASIYDVYNKRIPNYLVIILTVLGFSYNYLLIENAGLAIALYGLLAGLIVALIFYRLVSLGAGDVKLIASIGCFIGYPLILTIIAYSYMISAVLGVVYIKLWLPWYQNKKPNTPKQKKILAQRIPMAPGISIATFYVLYKHSF
jgi:prepilin peptidase CpaA